MGERLVPCADGLLRTERRARPLEVLGRPAPELGLENPPAVLVLLHRFPRPTEPREEVHHRDVSGLRERVDRHAGTSIRERFFGVVAEPGSTMTERIEGPEAFSRGLAPGGAHHSW